MADRAAAAGVLPAPPLSLVIEMGTDGSTAWATACFGATIITCRRCGPISWAYNGDECPRCRLTVTVS